MFNLDPQAVPFILFGVGIVAFLIYHFFIVKPAVAAPVVFHTPPPLPPAKEDPVAATHVATLLTATSTAVATAHTVITHPAATAETKAAATKLLDAVDKVHEATKRAATHTHPAAKG